MLNPSEQRESQYSADVSMYINTPNGRLEVAGCSKNMCILRHAVDSAPFDGELVIIIDGKEHRTAVSFPKGLSRDTKAAEYSEVSTPISSPIPRASRHTGFFQTLRRMFSIA